MNIETVAPWISLVSVVWGVAFGTIGIIDLIKKIKIQRIVLVNIIGALVVLGLSIVLPLFFQSPEPPTDFKVVSIHSGQVIQQQDLPLTIRGTDSSEGSSSGTVSVILVDSRGQYYLQTPPVHFQPGGTWIASNIEPLVGIVEIDFVFVDSAGSLSLTHWGTSAFPQLPGNSKTLTTIRITSQATSAV